MKHTLFLLLALLVSQLSAAAGPTYNIRDFGAVGDGQTIDSPAINRAIEVAAEQGGGVVYVPAGTYACYSIRLKSRIHLYLEMGATILAAAHTDSTGYDAPEENPHDKYQDFGHSHWKNSLIWGIDLEDVAITGQGLINGRGLTREESRRPGIGNKAISLKNCNRVVLRGFSMYFCGHFALLASGVNNLTIADLTIDTNRDGLDIDCCKNVKITGCTVNSPWDDAIVLKASYALGAFVNTENVTISDCIVSGYDRGTVYGGTFERDEPWAPDQAGNCGRIKIGTESSGGFKNIAITNCIFDRCRGLAIESVDGGALEDLVVSNITMRDIVNAPIFLRLGSRMRSPQGIPVGSISRVHISHVNVYNADSQYSCILSGVPGACIQDVSLTDIHIYYQGGYTAEDGLIVPPEREAVYPDPLMFGTIPAKGVYLRHVKDIFMDKIFFHYEKPDGRPLFVEDDAERITYLNIYEDGIKQ